MAREQTKLKKIKVSDQSILPQLGKVPLFRFLSKTAVERLYKASDVVECEAGQRIIHEGEVETDVFVVLESSVAVIVNQQDKDSYVSTLGPGQVVGEAALFTTMSRTASVETQGPVRMLRFDRESFVQALLEDPNDGMRVLYMLVHDLLRKLREVNLELAFERRLDSSQDDVDSLIDSLVPQLPRE